MTKRTENRKLAGILLTITVVLSACAPVPSIPRDPAPIIGHGYPENLRLAEPGPSEIVVVINDNVEIVHAGMFAAHQLFDPAGSYQETRNMNARWPGTSLADYVRFQLEDGPQVKLYRFTLAPDTFAQIKSRIDASGVTVPLFCAARVQNVLSGIAPFTSVPDAWLVSPALLAYHLDRILKQNALAGACDWPDGTSCHPHGPE